MKIGVVYDGDVFEDTRGWSGTLHQLALVLSKKYQLESVGPLRMRFYCNSYDIINDFKSALKKQHYDRKLSFAYSKILGRRIENKLKKGRYDILFAPNATSEIAFLNTNIPIIYLSDYTFASINEYYPWFSNWAEKSCYEANLIHKYALERAAAIILSSNWAKDSACNDYQISSEKIFVLKFGANMSRIPAVGELIKPNNKRLQLLFLGVEWGRKGGTIAIETVKELNRMGYPTELTIIGCNPPINKHESIKVIPFLHKANPDQFELLYKTLLKTDFLILPTKAECSAVVFAEVAAFGIPSITTETGGLPDYVENGVNGYRLPLEANCQEYAELIASIYNDKERYLKLRKQSRGKYETELNYNVWLDQFDRIVEMLMSKNGG